MPRSKWLPERWKLRIKSITAISASFICTVAHEQNKKVRVWCSDIFNNLPCKDKQIDKYISGTP